MTDDDPIPQETARAITALLVVISETLDEIEQAALRSAVSARLFREMLRRNVADCLAGDSLDDGSKQMLDFFWKKIDAD